MTQSTASIVGSAIGEICLNILVFGPQVTHPSEQERTRALQDKRSEIRAQLEAEGHNVKFAEDLVDIDLPHPMNNSVLQEIAILHQYDLVVVLIESPGSILEATIVGTNPDLARKSSLFIDQDFRGGLVGGGLIDLAGRLGADANTFEYPKDLVECHLLGKVREKVQTTKLVKYLS